MVVRARVVLTVVGVEEHMVRWLIVKPEKEELLGL
jgi:hypothetical protein